MRNKYRLWRVPLWSLVPVIAVAIAACGSSSSSRSNSGSGGGSGAAADTATATATSTSSNSGSASLGHLLPADIRNSGSLTIATDASYPPCEYFPKPGEPMIGFEPDLWNAMGAKLGVKIKAVNTAFDGL